MSEGGDQESGQPSDRRPTYFTLQIQLPIDSIHALMEEIVELQAHTAPGRKSHQFLHSVIRSLKAAEVVTHPEQVSLRDRLRFASEYARSSAERMERADHPAAATLRRISDTLDEILEENDEEIQRRLPEVDNLIRRLNEFAVG